MTEQAQEAVERVAAALSTKCHEPYGVLLDMARAAIAALPPQAPTVAEAARMAEIIEKKGYEHDRFLSGWGLPDNCIAVFHEGNITCYLPILTTPKGDTQ